MKAARKERTVVLPLTRLTQPYVQYDLEGSRLVRVRSAREGDSMDAEGFADVGLLHYPLVICFFPGKTICRAVNTVLRPER